MAILDILDTRPGSKDLDEVDVRAIAEDTATGTAVAVGAASDAARERLDRVTDMVRDVARQVGAAGSDVRLDEVVQRLRAVVPASTIRGVMTRLERELPDTDKDRYDRAYERGRVQTRTLFLGVGAAVGIAAGVTAAILFDPQRGPARRARIGAWKGDVARQLGERSKAVADRAKSMASERGIGASKAEQAADEIEAKAKDVAGAATERELVPVMAMDDAIETAVAPIADAVAEADDVPTPVAHG